MKIYNIFIVSAIVTLLASCNKSTENQEQTKVPVKDTSAPIVVEAPGYSVDSAEKASGELPVATNPLFDQFAHIAAGLTLPDTAKMASICAKPEWKKFAQKFDSSWNQIEKDRLSAMRSWKDTELKDINANPKHLLYAFSGPDFLNAFTFFPTAPNFTMIALEPVGQVKDLSKLKDAELAKYVNSVDESLIDIFEKSYFITRKMLQHLQRDKADGTLPLLCVFLAKTGNKILDIKSIKLDSLGKETESDWDFKARRSAVRIYFAHPNNPKLKRSLTYFKADMEDKALSKNKPLLAYLNNLGEVNSYLKSASYLLHYKDFSVIRNILLNQSLNILQDDTGIAYHFYDKKKWNFTLYGKYTKPVEDFAGVDQKDLRKLYDDSLKVKKMPFSLGYHWSSKTQNLMVARKK